MRVFSCNAGLVKELMKLKLDFPVMMRIYGSIFKIMTQELENILLVNYMGNIHILKSLYIEIYLKNMIGAPGAWSKEL